MRLLGKNIPFHWIKLSLDIKFKIWVIKLDTKRLGIGTRKLVCCIRLYFLLFAFYGRRFLHGFLYLLLVCMVYEKIVFIFLLGNDALFFLFVQM